MGRLYSNNYSTTITTASVGTGDTSFDVASVIGLPLIGAGDYSMITITDSLTAPTKTEIVKATDLSGSTLTVERAQEGTTAQAWVTGDIVELRATAESFHTLDGTDVVRYRELVNNSATVNLNRVDGGIQVLTLVTNSTLTVTLDEGESLLLHIINGSTYTVTWPTLKWITGIEPNLIGADVVTFWKIGVDVFASYGGHYVA